MIDFNKKGMPRDLSWFARRYNALIVDFPSVIDESLLKQDDICSRFDLGEACAALRSAHSFLTSISGEMLSLPEQGDKRLKYIKRIITKLDLIWALGVYGELCEEGSSYCIKFKKPLRSGGKTLPKNYSAALASIAENGCHAEYFIGGQTAKDFNSCDSGAVYFDDVLTALGIYLFVKKCVQKRWYWKEDKAGSYTKVIAFNPAVHCVEPFNRVDMRVFNCGDRLVYDIYEQLAGYNDGLIGCFKMIYDFVSDNYPECLPGHGFYNYVVCSINFSASPKHGMLGSVGVGHDEHVLGFYGGMPEEAKAENAEFADHIKLGAWFDIKSEADTRYAIRVMAAKAKYGKNILSKK